MDYKAWYTVDAAPADYYAQIAAAPKAAGKDAARTRDVDGAVPGEEREKYGEVEFATLTVRALKSDWTEDVCETYGEVIYYDGSLPDFPDFFQFENNIKFPAGKDIPGVCGNVTGLTEHSRYKKVFKTTGDRSTHIKDTHNAFDALVINAPEY